MKPIPKPKHLGPEYADQFKDESVASAYLYRPPYPAELFDVLDSLIQGKPRLILDMGCGTGRNSDSNGGSGRSCRCGRSVRGNAENGPNSSGMGSRKYPMGLHRCRVFRLPRTIWPNRRRCQPSLDGLVCRASENETVVAPNARTIGDCGRPTTGRGPLAKQLEGDNTSIFHQPGFQTVRLY